MSGTSDDEPADTAELTWSTRAGLRGPNPFVGPRPLVLGEALHGRDSELHALLNLLKARRIVVLHSPAGAGKSSLVHAGLVPRLKEARFDVWKSIRVDLDPAVMDDVPEGTNRFLLSTKVSLESELPEAHRRPASELAPLGLGEYLEGRPRRKGRAGRSVALIFEQFERILTVDPQGLEDKQEFFEQLGEALESEKYWALFLMREEHLPALAPYRDRIPTQLANTLRLDQFTVAQARDVALELAQLSGRSFPAVDRLIDELAKVQVQRSDGTFVTESGRHVEPVHLQVVGRRLWDSISMDDLAIDAEDVGAHARVADALGRYYADAVRAIARGDDGLERAIRHWFSRQLIEAGSRSSVRYEAERSGGLDNRVIDQLRSGYLVRTEPHAGALWLELGHDCLVQPILQDNDAWERAHLHSLQVKARRWHDEGRDPSLLLSADAMQEASAWIEEHEGSLFDEERDFVARSRAELANRARRQAAAQRQRKAARWPLIAAVVAVVVALSLCGVMWSMGNDVEQAERAREQAERDAARHEQRFDAMQTCLEGPAMARCLASDDADPHACVQQCEPASE